MRTPLQYSYLFLLLLGQYVVVQAQQDGYLYETTHLGQIVRGTVIDQTSNAPLIYATIELLNYTPTISTVTDENGRFELRNVPLGRQRIRIERYEYHSHIKNILVGAGKEVVLEIGLEEEFNPFLDTEPTDDFVLKDRHYIHNNELDPVNNRNSVSYRTIKFEEVNRYSGSLEDPARVVSNFASTYHIDDRQNHMIVRGNSPFGNQWRIDGIPLNNPHHLARLGNTGATFSMLSANVLEKADFLTGPASAEYNNAFSSIFDIQTRKGNNKRLEFAGEISLWEAEVMLEGPIKKGAASFILSYRHSVVPFARTLGIDTNSNSIPSYQDLNLKIDIPTQGFGHFSLFALGGISTINSWANRYKASDISAIKNVNAYTATQMSLVGVNHKKFIGEKNYLKTTVSYLLENYESDKDSLTPTKVSLDYYKARSMRHRIGLSSNFNTKWNVRLSTHAGIYCYAFLLNINEQNLFTDRLVYFSDDVLFHTGGFMQAKFKVSPRFILHLGVHGQYFTLNSNSWSIEPRFSFNWLLGKRHKISFGYGWHSRLKPFPISFAVQPNDDLKGYNTNNRNLGLLNSQQVVLSYRLYFGEQWAMKVNAYGQYNTNIPVDQLPSSFSLINYGHYKLPHRVDLVDDGVSFNAGGELSFEKFLSQGYYGIVSGSYFRSLYQASDQVWRNTSFDIQYMAKLVVGKEFKIGPKKRNAFTIDLRATHRGAPPYTPILLTQSQAAGVAVYEKEKVNSLRLAPYTRIDFKIGARFNGKKISHLFFVDIFNVANLSNPGQVYYDAESKTVKINNQLGLIPNILYRVEF